MKNNAYENKNYSFGIGGFTLSVCWGDCTYKLQ